MTFKLLTLTNKMQQHHARRFQLYEIFKLDQTCTNLLDMAKKQLLVKPCNENLSIGSYPIQICLTDCLGSFYFQHWLQLTEILEGAVCNMTLRVTRLQGGFMAQTRTGNCWTCLDSLGESVTLSSSG